MSPSKRIDQLLLNINNMIGFAEDLSEKVRELKLMLDAEPNNYPLVEEFNHAVSFLEGYMSAMRLVMVKMCDCDACCECSK